MSDERGTSVIFDLDGTLVDSELNYYEAGRRMLAEHGVMDFSWERHTDFIGISTRETVATLREEYGIDTPVDVLLADKNRHYLALAGTSTTVFPEMGKFVELLHGDGTPMAVASGSSRAAIEAILRGTGLDVYFRTVVSAEEVPQGKPAPDVFEEAARRLGSAPGDCVVVEDASPGVVAARAAGMRCVAVPYVPATAADPAFTSADLLYAGGQADFSAQATYDWLNSH
ncbi:HAD family phosphatase [Streptomyces sp. NPDC005953]|uniref:HAD family hydrolase n=1 Tax=unclassified Streptomyces TaxID=2593676 RepID=UPI003402326F